nr:hypothetical protein [uncultured Pseudomonas sp.]
MQEIAVKLEGAVAALDPEARMRDEGNEGLGGEPDDFHFDDEDVKESVFDDSYSQDDPVEQAQCARRSALDKVLRASSINDLFRELARRLHPTANWIRNSRLSVASRCRS